jgi:hypothetical protein
MRSTGLIMQVGLAHAARDGGRWRIASSEWRAAGSEQAQRSPCSLLTIRYSPFSPVPYLIFTGITSSPVMAPLAEAVGSEDT